VSTAGRKFDLTRLSLWQNWCVSIGAMVAVCLKPDAAVHIVGIVGSYALMQTGAIVSFSGANAYVSGKHAPAAEP